MTPGVLRINGNPKHAILINHINKYLLRSRNSKGSWSWQMWRWPHLVIHRYPNILVIQIFKVCAYDCWMKRDMGRR